MTKKALEDLLKEAARLEDGTYHLEPGASNGLLLSAGGTMVTLEQLVKVVLHAGYLMAETRKGERYLLDLGCVMGIKVGAPPVDGAGFV